MAAKAALSGGRTALHQASWQKQPDVVRALLAQHADVNAEDDEGKTPLHMAATAEIAGLLLEHGADPRARTKEGETPLFNASIALDTGILETLLRKGGDPNTALPPGAPYAGWTPLHFVIHHSVLEKTECARLLIDAGARVNAADSDGLTPLHLAVEAGSEALVTMLLKHGADPAARTTRKIGWDYFEHPKGTRPIDAVRGEPRIATLLRGAGQLTSEKKALVYPLVKRDGEWKCVVPLSSETKAGLAKALKAMTGVIEDVEQSVFANPEYGSRDRRLGFELAASKGKRWDEAKFFAACCAHKGLHRAVMAFVEAVCVANGEGGAETIYVHDELEEGTEAIRALLRVKAAGALRLYLRFLKSIDLEHTVETSAVIDELRALHGAKELAPILRYLREEGSVEV